MDARKPPSVWSTHELLKQFGIREPSSANLMARVPDLAGDSGAEFAALPVARGSSMHIPEELGARSFRAHASVHGSFASHGSVLQVRRRRRRRRLKL